MFPRVLIFLVLITGVQTSFAAVLTPAEVERVRTLKEAVQDVDRKSLTQTIKDLEKTGHPQTYLCMREAMAKTYEEIVKEQSVQGKSKKVWLYSMVNLNMAYLQFVGTKVKAKSASQLDTLICRKLKAYLPQDIDNQPGFHYSVD